VRLRSFRPKFPAFFAGAQRQLIAESDCGVATVEALPEGVLVTMATGARYLVSDIGVGELEPVAAAPASLVGGNNSSSNKRETRK
jgi:hypothetical protein